MEQAIKDLWNLPHNQIRKLMALKAGIGNLEGLQRQYRPIFDEDPAINRLLKQMRAEHDTLLSALRARPDAADLLENVFQENQPE